jgi:hypothetical protein
LWDALSGMLEVAFPSTTAMTTPAASESPNAWLLQILMLDDVIVSGRYIIAASRSGIDNFLVGLLVYDVVCRNQHCHCRQSK